MCSESSCRKVSVEGWPDHTVEFKRLGQNNTNMNHGHGEKSEKTVENLQSMDAPAQEKMLLDVRKLELKNICRWYSSRPESKKKCSVHWNHYSQHEFRSIFNIILCLIADGVTVFTFMRSQLLTLTLTMLIKTRRQNFESWNYLSKLYKQYKVMSQQDTVI